MAAITRLVNLLRPKAAECGPPAAPDPAEQEAYAAALRQLHTIDLDLACEAATDLGVHYRSRYPGGG